MSVFMSLKYWMGVVLSCCSLLWRAARSVLALLPLVLKGNALGHEIEHPMAVVILGSLATSTELSLFIMLSLHSFGHSAKEGPRERNSIPAGIRSENDITVI